MMRKFKSARMVLAKRGIDFQLFFVTLAIALFGLMMVYNSSLVAASRDFDDKYYFLKQQSVWLIIGSISMFFVSKIDYHLLEKFATPILIVSIFLLLAVLVPGLGVSAYGASRWINIFGITIQPSEIIKFATIIFLAKIFQDRVRVIPFLVIVGLVSFIVGVLQRDLGTTIIFTSICVSMFFLAGAPVRYFLLMIPVLIMAIIGLVSMAPYRLRRIMAFIDPFSDMQNNTYHISQILIALGSGGLFGLGIGESRQKFAYIPEVTTDSIFSIIGEEFGFFGSFGLILAFVFLFFKGLSIAQNASDSFGKLLGSGVVMWLSIQVIINLAAMVSLIPLTGVPLPFISYGGSALVSNMIGIGILLSISRYQK